MVSIPDQGSGSIRATNLTPIHPDPLYEVFLIGPTPYFPGRFRTPRGYGNSSDLFASLKASLGDSAKHSLDPNDDPQAEVSSRRPRNN